MLPIAARSGYAAHELRQCDQRFFAPRWLKGAMHVVHLAA
jgi:hypothetical protein